MSDWHIGRSWTTHEIEDSCSCEQEVCGLVRASQAGECLEHGLLACRTIRQGHKPEDCPGKKEEA